MYAVALLVEHRMEDLDADQVVALHEALDDEVVYHLVLPVPSSAALFASSLGSLGGTPAPVTQPDVALQVHDDLRAAAEADLAASAELLRARGSRVETLLTEDDPVQALERLVPEQHVDEVIVLTEPHLVQELLRVDWASRAQRHLDVPTLHLLEHVPFSAQA
ncbi:MAG: hypothetical protein PGN07_11320 [Aeromicrobium erythreum]